jgi:hypothetical protein
VHWQEFIFPDWIFKLQSIILVTIVLKTPSHGLEVIYFLNYIIRFYDDLTAYIKPKSSFLLQLIKLNNNLKKHNNLWF